MTKWVTKKLGDLIIDSYAGGTPNRGRDDYYGGDIPWVSSGEVNNPEITSTIENITLAGLTNSSAKWIPANSILVALYGATAGQVSMLRIKATSNQAVLAIIPNNEIIDTDFLYNQIKFNKQALLFLAQGSGQPNLSKNIVDRLEITYPESLAEQRRIAGILSSADGAIAASEALIAKYRNIKRGLLATLLQPKEGWKKVKLGECCSIHGRIGFRGYTTDDLVEKGYGAITFSPSDIIDFRLNYEDCDYISWAKYEESPEIKVYNGDILFCKTASIGKCALVEGLKEKATINPQFVVLKDFTCDPKYLFYQLSSYEFQTQIQGITGGSTIKTMSQEKFGLEEIAFPVLPDGTLDFDEQKRIASILSSIDDNIAIEQSIVEKYKGVKKGLMEELLKCEK